MKTALIDRGSRGAGGDLSAASISAGAAPPIAQPFDLGTALPLASPI